MKTTTTHYSAAKESAKALTLLLNKRMANIRLYTFEVSRDKLTIMEEDC